MARASLHRPLVTLPFGARRTLVAFSPPRFPARNGRPLLLPLPDSPLHPASRPRHPSPRATAHFRSPGPRRLHPRAPHFVCTGETLLALFRTAPGPSRPLLSLRQSLILNAAP